MFEGRAIDHAAGAEANGPTGPPSDRPKELTPSLRFPVVYLDWGVSNQDSAAFKEAKHSCKHRA